VKKGTKGNLKELRVTLKLNYTMFPPDDAAAFNWGYITGLNHHGIIDDGEYMKLYDCNKAIYINIMSKRRKKK